MNATARSCVARRARLSLGSLTALGGASRALWAASATPFAAPLQQSAPGPGGGLLRVVLALIVVLAAVLAAAWLARRMRSFSGSGSGANLEMAGAIAALGTRERAVLAKASATAQVLIGVAPGSVRTLHVLERASLPLAAALPSDAGATLALPRARADIQGAAAQESRQRELPGRAYACPLAAAAGALLALMLLDSCTGDAGGTGALLPATAAASARHRAFPRFTVHNGGGGRVTYTLTIQLLALMTAITLLPALLLMMTAFTRIIIVLSILRQAIGAGQSPPNQVLLGLALFLTLFVMSPVIDKVRTDCKVTLRLHGRHRSIPATALERGVVPPLKTFMLAQTQAKADIAAFVRISGSKGFASPQDVPLTTLAPAFVTSELKTAFQIGFLLFIPFVIIDLVVASVLMSMGMMMLSPVLISLPFKLMLFVLVDGWSLVMGSLASSFFH